MLNDYHCSKKGLWVNMKANERKLTKNRNDTAFGEIFIENDLPVFKKILYCICRNIEKKERESEQEFCPPTPLIGRGVYILR